MLFNNMAQFVEQKSSNTGLLIKLFYKLSIFIINDQTFLLIIKLCFKATTKILAPIYK